MPDIVIDKQIYLLYRANEKPQYPDYRNELIFIACIYILIVLIIFKWI